MPAEAKKNCIIDCRVSDPQQLKGGSLENQEDVGRRYAERNGWRVLKVFRKSHSATTTERDDLEEILGFIKHSTEPVHYYICKSIDRFTRAGYSEYERRKRALGKLGVQLVDSQGIVQPNKNTLEHLGDFRYWWSDYSPSEAAEIFTAQQGKQEVRDILTRLIGAEIRLVQEGYAVRRGPDGMQNKRIMVGHKERYIREPSPERAPYFQKMFELRAQGLDDKDIVARINAMGFRTAVYKKWDRTDKENPRVIGQVGGRLLTVKQLQRYIQQTEYAGVLCEKWTKHRPIKAKYDGLVSIDTFNRANRGKVYIDYRSDQDISILYDHHPQRAVSSRSKYNPLYPYKCVLCPLCRKPFVGSSSKGKSGKGFPAYHCSRGHKYFRVKKATFDENVERFIRSLNFDPDYRESMEATLLNKYREREKEILQDSAQMSRSVADLKTEQAVKVEAIVATTSAVVRAQLETQVEALEVQIKRAESERGKIEITEADIKSFVRDAKRAMEHPAEILLEPTNPRVQEALFSLVFEETPTYDEIVNGTPKLTWVFKLSDDFATNKSHSVHLASLDWNTFETTVLRWNEVFRMLHAIKAAYPNAT